MRLPSFQMHVVCQSQRRPGSALVLVLVVIAMLSLGAYTYSELMVTEYRAADAYGRQRAVQAWAESGVEYITALLAPDGGGWDQDMYHNPALFHVSVEEGGGFTIVAPLEDPSDTAVLRMGVMDESARINLNALALLDPADGMARTLLMGLPGMTEEIADNMLDWVDADQDVREFGAEQESDAILPPRNGPLQSLEELLLVPGVTAALLYGEDANRNGLLDPNENDGDVSLPYDNADGLLDLGWSEFFTLTSKESNLQHDPNYYGQPRLNVNQSLLTDLYDQLEERLGANEAQFVTAYRLNGPLTAAGSGTSGSGSSSSNSSSSGGSSSSSGGSGSSSSGGRSSSGSSGSGSGSSSSTGSGSTSSSGTSSGSSSSSGGSRSGGLSTSSSGSSTSSGISTTGNAATDQALQGMASGLASALGGASGAVTRGGMDVSAGGSTQINSIYELIGAQVSATIDGQTTTLDSPWKADPGSLQQILPQLLDTLTYTDDEEIQGRININQARREILVGIPQMPSGVPDAIIASRAQRLSGTSATAGRFATAGWLLIEGLVDLETMRALDSSITAQGHVLRVQVLGHADRPGPIARVEAVLDGTKSVPQLIFQRSLPDLGAGFRSDQLPAFSDAAAFTQNNR